jgi:hypothetical protein
MGKYYCPRVDDDRPADRGPGMFKPPLILAENGLGFNGSAQEKQPQEKCPAMQRNIP